ncbi:hypothetical protein PVAG01_08422 [Phlyctema vagabunda]|uniref:Uncharacterized protein n=1 Tax=Phlyctema vagabunda TaxID=108571 RepID=A0ABR4P9D1_9HELO
MPLSMHSIAAIAIFLPLILFMTVFCVPALRATPAARRAAKRLKVWATFRLAWLCPMAIDAILLIGSWVNTKTSEGLNLGGKAILYRVPVAILSLATATHMLWMLWLLVPISLWGRSPRQRILNYRSGSRARVVFSLQTISITSLVLGVGIYISQRKTSPEGMETKEHDWDNRGNIVAIILDVVTVFYAYYLNDPWFSFLFQLEDRKDQRGIKETTADLKRWSFYTVNHDNDVALNAMHSIVAITIFVPILLFMIDRLLRSGPEGHTSCQEGSKEISDLVHAQAYNGRTSVAWTLDQHQDVRRTAVRWKGRILYRVPVALLSAVGLKRPYSISGTCCASVFGNICGLQLDGKGRILHRVPVALLSSATFAVGAVRA